jgi:thymidylate synthase (FAD)
MSRVILYHSSLSEASLSKIAGISRDSSKGPLVKDLLGWGHLSPLEFASLTYLVECPIYVARQLMRHRTGKYMERSLRYTKAEDMILPQEISLSIRQDVGRVLTDYYNLVGIEGMDKECARAILPMGTMTKFYAQYDLRNFLNLCKYRLAEDAQQETQEVVEMMVDEMKDVYPSVYDYIQEGFVR